MRTPILTAFAVSLCTLPALAQEAPSSREAEIKTLEAMLARVDAALATLEPVAQPPMTLAQYDIRHLLYAPTDRLPPSMTIPSDAAGFRTGAGKGGFVFSFEDEEESYGLDVEQIETMLTQAVGEEAWDDPASIEIADGYLIVNQTAPSHARIQRLLTQLKQRETRSIQLEVGFYSLPTALQLKIEAAALSGRGSLSPAILTLLDRSVESGDAKLSGSAMLTALDEQRVYLHQGSEQAIVSDYEQSSGGTGQVVGTVADPIVEVLRTGLTLGMRATLSGEGIRPRVSMDVRFVRTRPLEMAHSETPWGAIDMPRVSVDSVRTSARVSSGGGMLVFSARASRDEAQPDVTIIVRPLVVGAGRQ